MIYNNIWMYHYFDILLTLSTKIKVVKRVLFSLKSQKTYNSCNTSSPLGPLNLISKYSILLLSLVFSSVSSEPTATIQTLQSCDILHSSCPNCIHDLWSLQNIMLTFYSGDWLLKVDLVCSKADGVMVIWIR